MVGGGRIGDPDGGGLAAGTVLQAQLHGVKSTSIMIIVIGLLAVLAVVLANTRPGTSRTAARFARDLQSNNGEITETYNPANLSVFVCMAYKRG